MTDHHRAHGHSAHGHSAHGHSAHGHSTSGHEAGHSSGQQSGRPQYDDVNTGIIVLVGLISAIITFLIIGFVQGLAYRWESYFQQSRVEIVNQTVKAEVDAQKSVLTTVGGADGQPVPGRVTIDEAMQRTLEKFKQPSGANKTSNSSETSNPGNEVASGQ